jgi:5-methylcytosine-specific restriction endonuclease McrA
MAISKKIRQKIYDKYDGHCAYCGCILEKGWHVDELLPVRRRYKTIPSYFVHKETGNKIEFLGLMPDGDNRTMYNYVKSKTIVDGCEHPENYNIENQMPSCPVCNINKHSDSLENFRKLIQNFPRTLNETKVQYRMAKKYGLIIEDIKPVVFYFEKVPNETK